jgi:hypothetical protein
MIRPHDCKYYEDITIIRTEWAFKSIIIFHPSEIAKLRIDSRQFKKIVNYILNYSYDPKRDLAKIIYNLMDERDVLEMTFGYGRSIDRIDKRIAYIKEKEADI